MDRLADKSYGGGARETPQVRQVLGTVEYPPS